VKVGKQHKKNDGRTIPVMTGERKKVKDEEDKAE